MSKPISVFRSPSGEAKFMAEYDAQLSAWPLPYEVLDVPGRFGRTHIVACGPREAPPLFLLHGFSTTPIEWRENVTDFARGHRVYCVSGLGDIGKSVPTRVPATREEATLWLTEVFDELKIDKARVAGHSYGGFLTTMLAIYAPDRVEKIVPIAPAGFAALTFQFWVRVLAFALLRRRSLIESNIGFLYSERSPRNARIDSHMALCFEHAKPVVKVAGQFSDDELRRIHAPVLFLVGQDERCFDPHNAVARAKRFIPSIDVQIIPDAGHALPFERPDIVNATVLRFFG